MQPDLSFYIAMDGSPYPVRFEPEVLDEFQREHVQTMDHELTKFATQWFGPAFSLDHESRLGVVAQLIRDAVKDENGILVAKYVLWMASRYPEISGIRIQEDTYEFMAAAFDEIAFENQSIH